MKRLRFQVRSAIARRLRLLARTAILASVFAGTARAAEDLDFSLVAPRESVAPGEAVSVELVVLNRLAREAPVALPPSLEGAVIDGANRWPVRLVPASAQPAATVPAGGFAAVPFVFEMPAVASASVNLAIEEPAPLRAVFAIAPPPRERASPAAVPDEEPPEIRAAVSERPTALAHLTRYYADNFAVYEPMYFLGGADAPAAKFQLSFRYRLVSDDGWAAQRFPYLRGLTFAYTQRTLWDIGGDSSPFYDTSYLPELGYVFLASDPEQKGPFTWLGWQAALQHESNGKGGLDSRSLNTIFARGGLALGDLDGWHLIVSPKVFAYLGESDGNGDIADYRGYGELRLVLGRNDGLALSATTRTGKGFDHGAAQVDLTIPTRMFGGNVASFFQIQYWTGYGESLLDYDKRTETVRAGIALVR